MKFNLTIFSTLLLVSSMEANAQNEVIYDESKVPNYELPELLVSDAGKTIGSTEEWETVRRKEILKAFENEVYGKTPGSKEPAVAVNDLEEGEVFDGLGTRKQVKLVFDNSISIDLLMYLPNGIENPPVFIGLNFLGNHTISDDDNIVLPSSWVPAQRELNLVDNKPNEASRGHRASRWPVETILKGGFALVTAYYGDIDPDYDDFSNGIHPAYYDDESKPADDEWGAIGAWAWGYSRILDYLEGSEMLSASRFVAFGHSRIGKAALWAGAQDQRFDAVISNNSGCGGAALSMRLYGETVGAINKQFPHWFNTNFKKYNQNESALPVDQHMLLALIAPRPLYVASAEDDQWADPRGEYLSLFHAGKVYDLYEKASLESPESPSVNQPIMKGVGYHIRTGKHDVTEYDWLQYMAFCKNHF